MNDDEAYPNRQSLLEFPCVFPIKVLGRDEPGFRLAVRELLRPLTGALRDGAVSEKSSANARFVSLTITMTAQSREQLDAIYQALTDEPSVLVAL